MNKENCPLKLVDEIILYYDARSKKHQIKKGLIEIFLTSVWGVGCSGKLLGLNLGGCRLHLKCDCTRAEIRFRLPAKRTSPFKSAGASVQSSTDSRGVRISGSNGSNAGYTMFRGSVKSTGYLWKWCIQHYYRYYCWSVQMLPGNIIKLCKLSYILATCTRLSRDIHWNMSLASKKCIRVIWIWKEVFSERTSNRLFCGHDTKNQLLGTYENYILRYVLHKYC